MHKYHYSYLGNFDHIRRKGFFTLRSVIWCILVFLGVTTLFYWSGYDLTQIGVDSQHLNLEIIYDYHSDTNTNTWPQSRCHGEGRIVGGVPGFYVFDKIWYKSGEFYIFTDQPDQITLPPLTAISSGSNPIRIRPLSEWPDLQSSKHRKPHKQRREVIRCYLDETIWMNIGVPSYSVPLDNPLDPLIGEDGLNRRSRIAKRFNWEFHHYHFLAESLLGGIASLDITRHRDGPPSILQEEKDWLVVPWEEEWKDQYGLNEPIVSGLFHHHFVDSRKWNETTLDDNWIGFERVVIVDRWSSQMHNPQAIQWNKMALDIFNLLPSTSSSSLEVDSIFSPYRVKFLNYMDIQSLHRSKAGTAIHHIPKIVYVDRQSSSRTLLRDDHEGLLEVLGQLTKKGVANCVVGKLEEMKYQDQIRLFADADIIIGVHGNGLTHQMWMAPGGVVIEIFPPGVFLRDYQLIAQVVGHDHIAILNSRIYTRQEWKNEPGKLLATHPDEANDQNITLSQGFIEDLLYLKLTNYHVDVVL
ncbi:hypothetical protein V866_003764 [Kwoniella sp. B9012]|uniref:Glycosyltransferase 61 catalytic domain-containing protein n=1 Tax=Kwoniella europaea PYCC6329 TaxID=1423913 RepID=A0AAX4KGZ1_9TREE